MAIPIRPWGLFVSKLARVVFDPDITAPSVPVNVTATAASQSVIHLSWTASSDNQSGVFGYPVYRASSSNGAYTRVGLAIGTSFNDPNLSGSATWFYRVTSIDLAGNESAQSGTVSATTPDQTAPSVPASIAATPTSQATIHLSWAASTDTGGSGLFGYKVYRSASANGTFSLVGSPTAASFDDTGLQSFATWFYRVSAVDVTGNESAQSAPASATTLDQTAPSVPANLAAVATSSSQINLTWNASTDAGSGVKDYQVFRDGGATAVASPTTISFSDTGLTANSLHSYQISARDNSLNISAKSASVNASTLAGGPQTINVTTAAQLVAAIGTANAQPAVPTTVVLADGTYTLGAFLNITAPNFTAKSLSGNRANVIVQGDGFTVDSAVQFIFRIDANGFTVRDITLQHVRNSLLQFVGEHNVGGMTVDNCILQNSYEHMIKCSIDKVNAPANSVHDGLFQNCLFQYTAAAAPNYYTGAIDAHGAKNFEIRKNTAKRIASPAAQICEHVFHLWDGAADGAGKNRVEQNTFIDCDRDIGYGLEGIGSDGLALAACSGGLIINNYHFHSNNGAPFADTRIDLENTTGTEVYNNSGWLLHPYPNFIEARFADTTFIKIQNNLSNKLVALRDGASAAVNINNLTNAQASWFIDPTNGNLALSGAIAGVVDTGGTIVSVPSDFIGTARPQGSAYDIGAFEYINVSDPTQLPLLQQSNLTYLGYFQLDLSGGSNFEGGGGGLCIAGSTLYVGNPARMMMGRITLPTTYTGQTTSVISAPVSIAGAPGGANQNYLGGAIIYNNRMIVQKFENYDNADTNGTVFQAGTTGISGFSGLQGLTGANYRFCNNFMGLIPTVWQGLFGGAAFCGAGFMSINAGCSNGPAANVFNPDAVTGSGTVAVTPVLGYPLANSLGGSLDAPNQLAARADLWMAGMMFPTNYRTVLFVGRHGYGTPTYKVDDGGCGGSNGEGARPYRLQAWAYDAKDLLQVKSGQLQPWEPQPYAFWDITPSNFDSCVLTQPGGATYDPVTRRLVVTTTDFWPNLMRFHVWQVA